LCPALLYVYLQLVVNFLQFGYTGGIQLRVFPALDTGV
jgi:hypothetical protein